MSNRTGAKRGVTLLELMIVMVIIAILVGFLVPATIKMRKTAAETKVRSGRVVLRNAVLNFHAEYGLWPVGDQVTSNEVFASSEVIEQLRPTGARNVRHKLFWERPEDKITKLGGQEYSVGINPRGKKPIGSDSQSMDFDQRYTVYFLP